MIKSWIKEKLNTVFSESSLTSIKRHLVYLQGRTISWIHQIIVWLHRFIKRELIYRSSCFCLRLLRIAGVSIICAIVPSWLWGGCEGTQHHSIPRQFLYIPHIPNHHFGLYQWYSLTSVLKESWHLSSSMFVCLFIDNNTHGYIVGYGTKAKSTHRC